MLPLLIVALLDVHERVAEMRLFAGLSSVTVISITVTYVAGPQCVLLVLTAEGVEVSLGQRGRVVARGWLTAGAAIGRQTAQSSPSGGSGA